MRMPNLDLDRLEVAVLTHEAVELVLELRMGLPWTHIDPESELSLRLVTGPLFGREHDSLFWFQA
jgi:hypothetical protein